MPASFTPAFAERLDRLCAIRVKEAADGEVLEKGMALLAPGDHELVLFDVESGERSSILEAPRSFRGAPRLTRDQGTILLTEWTAEADLWLMSFD